MSPMLAGVAAGTEVAGMVVMVASDGVVSALASELDSFSGPRQLLTGAATDLTMAMVPLMATAMLQGTPLTAVRMVVVTSLADGRSQRAKGNAILEPNPTCGFIRRSTRGGKLMLKKLALATAAVGLLMSTASADYYIVQEKATKKCKVVETKPTDTTWIQVGPASFKTQSDAEKQVKTVCVEK